MSHKSGEFSSVRERSERIRQEQQRREQLEAVLDMVTCFPQAQIKAAVDRIEQNCQFFI